MKKADKKTLYLVDVSSLFFRAYYAISAHLSSPKGLPTNALYGLLSMTDKFIKEHKSKYIVYCFDHKKPSFRAKMYPEYKANRGAMPEDLAVQVPYIKKLISALGIRAVERAGYEADDLIGSLTVAGCAQNFKVVIVSGDKDFTQLVSPAVSLYDPMREVGYDESGVKQKWGVLPKQMNDYLAIVGDSSDNIPGVLGIGPKGAQKLLEKYGNLKNIYKNLNDIPKNTADKLKEYKKNAFLSKDLARIVTDLDLTKSLPSFERQEIQVKQLRSLLQELGFKSFEKKLCGEKKLSSVPGVEGDARFRGHDGDGGHDSASASASKRARASGGSHAGKRGHDGDGGKDIKRLPSNLKLHTLSYEEIEALVRPYSEVWCFVKGKDYFLSYKNKVISLENQDLQKLGGLFSDRRVRWCGYDLKKIWKDFQCAHPLTGWCSMMAVYLIESGPPGGFDRVATGYVEAKINDDLTPGEIYRIHKNLRKELCQRLEDLKMMDLYERIELPLIAVLYEMENKGIMLDPGELKKQEGEVNTEIKKVEREIFSYAKHEFNISSPKQLADVLFKELSLDPVRKTKTGFSTDVEVLNKLKNKHPVVPLILEHRELFKLKTTYVEALPPLVKKQTGRVHTHFRQALTSTGRLSSVNPNLQNIPIKTSRGRKVRKAFIAPEGKKIISADYSQIELRILAHITEDPALCRAFKNDWDIHQATAGEIYSIPPKKVTPELRRQAKAVNFGLIYGQGPYTLSESLGISVHEAKEIIKNYFARFKGVKRYMDSVVERARKQGYVETLFGRRRVIQEVSSGRFQTKKWGERAAINAPIQGTAGDLVKKAMIELRGSLYSPILLQIHDELIFECDDDLLEEETAKIKNIMENTVQWKVPLKVHISTGQNWWTAHA